MKKPEDECSEALKALFCSLVGALAWLVQTRVEIAVYVTALQRWNQAPRIEHAKRANRVLSYCRRKETSFNFLKLPGDVKSSRIVSISDSAYKLEEAETRAMVGHLVCWGSATDTAPFGQMVPLHDESRRQKRVCRSTYAAEIRGLNDALETGKLLQLAIEEVLYGPLSAQQALKLDNAEGNFQVSLEAIIDAKGVYTSIENEDAKIPSESSLLSSVQAVREALVERRLTTLYWCDTRDMAADGLTKGSVERTSIILLYEQNLWKGIGDQPVAVSLAQVGGEPSVRDEDLSTFGGKPLQSGVIFENYTIYPDWTSLRA